VFLNLQRAAALFFTISRAVFVGDGECVQVTATSDPPLELKFVSKGGTLEIPPTGAICKVGKFCCLANNAIV